MVICAGRRIVAGGAAVVFCLAYSGLRGAATMTSARHPVDVSVDLAMALYPEMGKAGIVRILADFKPARARAKVRVPEVVVSAASGVAKLERTFASASEVEALPLRAWVGFDAQGLADAAIVGAWCHTSDYEALEVWLATGAEKTGEQTVAELKARGARFTPGSEPDVLGAVKQLPLERVFGASRVVSAQFVFLGRVRPMRADWDVVLQTVQPRREYVLRVEPFAGRVVGLTRTYPRIVEEGEEDF